MRIAVISSLILSAVHVTAATRTGVQCKGISNVWDALSDQCLCAPCHLCEFSIVHGRCQLQTFDGMDLTDGSDQPIDQPELRAKSWFLSEKQITDSRGGVKRNGLKWATSHNNVSTYVATSEFFDDLYQDLQATKANDHVYATGWSFDDVTLRPQDVNTDDFNSTTSLNLIQAMADKKVDMHFLGWINPFEWKQNVAFQDKVNSIQPGPSQGGTYFVFDDRLPDATASHHQKTIAIKRSEGIVAYVGGIDIDWNRWDTLAHNVSELRKQANIQRDSTNGWMDAHVRIDGPAAVDVATNFLQRWNTKTRPLQDLLDPVFPFENPDYTDLAPLTANEPLIQHKRGTHCVQIVRTYSCKVEDHYASFAPKGELSIYHSRLKALMKAKNYVYIEDQYFIYVPAFLEALIQVLPKLQRVIIVTQPASTETSLSGYRKYQYEMLTPLQKMFPNKVQIYRTKADRNIYIHSKFMIIDDVFLSIGSANWNRRSMSADTEIVANVVDEDTVKTVDGITVGKLARDYRIRKFMELTGKSYEELDGMKFLDAANALDTAADQEDTILARHQVEEDPSFLVYSDGVQDFVDPLQECS